MSQSKVAPDPDQADVSPKMAEELEGRVKVTCTQLANPGGGEPQGVILLMEETDGRP